MANNRIPRKVARLNIVMLVDTVAGNAGTPATVYKNDFDGYRMETENGTFATNLATLRNSNFVKIESVETFPAEPSLSSIEALREEYRRQYSRLYSGAGTEEIDKETRIYMSLFDVWQTKHVEFIGAFCRTICDYISSDRESAAFMLAVMRGDYTRKESPKKPRAIKTRTYNNFMKVLKIIMAKGYSFEESEAITRRIFDEYEAQPLELSILARVDLVVDKEPEPIEEPETETASREESTAPGEAMEEPATGEESTETGTTAETATGSRGYITINGDTLPRSGFLYAFENAPQRKECRKTYKYIPPKFKRLPRGSSSFPVFWANSPPKICDF